MSDLANGHDFGGSDHLPTGFIAAPRRAGDPDDEDWQDRRREARWRRDTHQPPPAPPAVPPWMTPSALLGALALLMSIAAPLVGIYPRLTAMETRLDAQSEMISDLRQQVGSLSSVDASIAAIQGELNSLTSRLDAQRQTLTAIEGALMDRADRPRMQAPGR